MKATGFRAGAGRAEILFPSEMFPTDNLYGVHDNPCARVLVLDAGVRVALVALELVNAPQGVIHTARENIERLTGTPYDNVWVHVTHAITTPHQPGGPGQMPGAPPPPQPPKEAQDPDAPKKRELFVTAIEKAVIEAAAAAAESFGEASFGVGVGHCDTNVNRDIETPFGWWIAQNPAEYSNKDMTILRVNKADGSPLAFLISYGIKPCAIDQAERKSPDRKVCTDVPGVACRLVEEAYGAPCLFFMSAAGDQIPREQAWYETVRDDGTVGEVDLGVIKGYEIVERLGAEMGNDAIRIAAQIPCSETETSISTASGFVCCDTRGTKPGPPSPKKELEYKKDGSVNLSAEAIQMGDIAFVAVKPETNAITEKQLQENSPFRHTLLISMVNGGMKYMPDQAAYDRVTWETQRSMLMPGSAERWVQRAVDMLHSLKAGKKEPVVTAFTEQFGDGQRITKAIVEFEDEVPDVNSIEVKNRTIVGRNAEGSTVTLELSCDDKAALVIPAPNGPGPGGPRGPGGPGGPGKRPPLPERKRGQIAVEVSIPGYSAMIGSTKAVQAVIDDFRQGNYKGILYNLFVPADYDSSKKYPLVMFIPDASANGSDPLLALSQGIGGTCWAEPSEQAKHPSFVLAVQIPKHIRLTNDDYEAAPELEDIKKLLDKIIAEYGVDTNRIYTTGQSQGCMASCELNIRYPELFAASMLVAGHWDLEKMSVLSDHRFLFGLSEGGLKEYPNFNAMTENYAKQGVDVGTVRLSFRDGWDVNEAKARAAIEGKQMAYIIFEKDTAFPDDGTVRPDMAHHSRGWELTYQLEAARDWLFAQHK